MGFRPSGLLAGCYIGGPKKRREKIACAYYEWEFFGFLAPESVKDCLWAMVVGREG
jgi:hypothetical protein